MTSADGWPPRFTLDGPRIMELLTGDRFYSSWDAALREAVLNAIDACGRRRVVDADYQPQVLVQFDEGTRSLTIIDNGDGMDPQTISTLFAKIGASASRVMEKTSRGQYQSVGEFRIGVVSYFLVCDEFDVHTVAADGTRTGLRFRRSMFDMETPADVLECNRQDRGTTIVVRATDQRRFDTLLTRFAHWVRDVPYLRATSAAKGELKQGQRRRHVAPIEVPLPDWIEKAEVGAPADLGVWSTLDGQAHVDVLYRGVFVQELAVPHVWGIEGSLHVNPKHFKPKLNRESFIAEGFEQAIQQFLREIHPAVLTAALDTMRPLLATKESNTWNVNRWITVWLAIPRSGAYAPVAQAWDSEFRQIKAFRLMQESGSKMVSLHDLENYKEQPIYVIPSTLEEASLFAKKAVAVLRARGAFVVQGLQRDSGYLANASMMANSTAEFLFGHFRASLPNLINAESVARQLVNDEQSLGTLLPSGPTVRLVKLGVSAAPVVRVDGALWLNVESKEGKALVIEFCDRNEGLLGLLVACQRHAPAHTGEVVAHLQGTRQLEGRLGPLKRQHLRRLVA